MTTAVWVAVWIATATATALEDPTDQLYACTVDSLQHITNDAARHVEDFFAFPQSLAEITAQQIKQAAMYSRLEAPDSVSPFDALTSTVSGALADVLSTRRTDSYITAWAVAGYVWNYTCTIELIKSGATDYSTPHASGCTFASTSDLTDLCAANAACPSHPTKYVDWHPTNGSFCPLYCLDPSLYDNSRLEFAFQMASQLDLIAPVLAAEAPMTTAWYYMDVFGNNRYYPALTPDTLADLMGGDASFYEGLVWASPLLSPTRRPIWSAPYYDPLSGLSMISVYVPVDLGEEWIALIGSDVVLSETEALLEYAKPTLNSFVLAVSTSDGGIVTATKPAYDAIFCPDPLITHCNGSSFSVQLYSEARSGAPLGLSNSHHGFAAIVPLILANPSGSQTIELRNVDCWLHWQRMGSQELAYTVISITPTSDINDAAVWSLPLSASFDLFDEPLRLQLSNDGLLPVEWAVNNATLPNGMRVEPSGGYLEANSITELVLLVEASDVDSIPTQTVFVRVGAVQQLYGSCFQDLITTVQLERSRLDGSIIAYRMDGGLVVLAFAVAVLGAWITLILVEQVHSRVRDGKEFLVWLVACPLALSICGIWPCVLIAAGAINRSDDGSIAYNPKKILPSLVPCCALVAVGWSMLYRPLRARATEAAKSSNFFGRRTVDQPKRGSLRVIKKQTSQPSIDRSVVHDEVTALAKHATNNGSPTNQAVGGPTGMRGPLHLPPLPSATFAFPIRPTPVTVVPVMPSAPDTHQNDSSATAQKHSHIHNNNNLNNIPSEDDDLLSARVDRRPLPALLRAVAMESKCLVLSIALCLAASVTTAQVMAVASISIGGEVHHGGLFVIANLCSLFLYGWSIGLLQLGRATRVRMAAPLLMGIGIALTIVIDDATLTLRYQSEVRVDSSALLSGRTLLVIGSTVTACAGFLFLNANMIHLKLSRDTLDVSVSELTEEVGIWKRRHARSQRDLSRQMAFVELINHSRPLHRTYADVSRMLASAGPTLVDSLADELQAPAEIGSAMSPLVNSKESDREAAKFATPLMNRLAVAPPPVDDKSESAAPITSTANNANPSTALPSAHTVITVASAPLPSRLPTPSLQQLIEHPVCLELLKDTLQSEHAVEGLMFYLDTGRYESIKSVEARRRMAHAIFDTFVTTESVYQVNLSSAMVQRISAQMVSCPRDLFSEARSEIFRLIASNTRFVASPAYDIACALVAYLPSHSASNSTSNRYGSVSAATTPIHRAVAGP